MKTALQFVYRTFCLFLVAIGFFTGLFAFCGVLVMGLVWIQEGRLLPDDQQILARAAAWFGGACFLVFVTWRLAKLAGKSDDSLRLRKTPAKAQQRSQELSLLVIFLMVAAGLWADLSGPWVARLSTFAGYLILVFLALHLQILVHELGHFVAAWGMKFDLRKMQIGAGPRLCSCSFANRFHLVWRAWPLGGFMMANDATTTHFRVRHFAFVAGGPLMDLIILWAGVQLIFGGGFSPAFLESSGRIPVHVIFIWTLLSTLGGLTPRTVWIGHRKVWSDGYWLWLLATASGKRLATLAAQLKWYNAIESFQSGDRPAWLEFASVAAGPTNPAASLETFRRQHRRLSSHLLRRPVS